MACLCSPSDSKVQTEGYVCSAYGGQHAHWLCSLCVSPSSLKGAIKCPLHRRATVLPVHHLHAITTLSPNALCRPPSTLTNELPTLSTKDINVKTAGARGHTFELAFDAVQQLQEPALLQIYVNTPHRKRVLYAAVWPGCQHGYTFPRLIVKASDTETMPPDNTVCPVVSASWTKAWNPTTKLMFGASLDTLASVMKSPCAQRRWWFLCPFAHPPLLIPPAAAAAQKCNIQPLGDCGVPIAPYNPALETCTITAPKGSTKRSQVRCAWCKMERSSMSQWKSACAPEYEMPGSYIHK